MQEQVMIVITFLIAAAVGLLILSSLWAGIGVNDTELNAHIENASTDVGSGVTVNLYNANTDTQIATATTDSGSNVTYGSVEPQTVYIEAQGTQSSNITLDDDRVDVTFDTDGALTVDEEYNGPYANVYSQIRSSIGSIYGILLVLPLVVVGAYVITILSRRFGTR